MIAVIASENERPAVREFFELFKTPWSFYSDEQKCDVLLCSNTEVPQTSARLVLIYEAAQGNSTTPISFGGDHFPIYCGCRTFENGAPFSIDTEVNGQTKVRFGFDLFA